MSSNVWISWNGSKKSECKKIFDGVDMNQFDAIADVFGGSGWLSLYAKKLNPKLKVFLNDADRELFNLLNSIKSGKLLEEIKTFEEKNPTYFEYLKESEKKKKAEKE